MSILLILTFFTSILISTGWILSIVEFSKDDSKDVRQTVAILSFMLSIIWSLFYCLNLLI